MLLVALAEGDNHVVEARHRYAEILLPHPRGQDAPGIHARHHLVEFRFLQLADDPLVRAVGLVRDDRQCRQVRIVERRLDLMDVVERLAGG